MCRHLAVLQVSAPLLRTVELLEARGYALPVHRVARLAQGGPLSDEQVRAAVASDPELRITSGLVHRNGFDVTRSLERQRNHRVHGVPQWEVAQEYTRRLARTCPWVTCALAAGSLSSEGFEEGDDLDFDLFVEDGTKYLAYLVALGVAVPFSWRARRAAKRQPGRGRSRSHARPGGAPHHHASTPMLPKVICLNLVVEDGQARPFARQDEAMAFEFLLARPLHGSQWFQDVLAHNGELVAHFPQLADVPAAHVHARPNLRHHLLRVATRPRWSRRLLDGVAYQVVRGLHAWVRWHRRHDPDALMHVTQMEAHKRPYGILERP